MPNETTESKAQKIAAAKKKLKEYQRKQAESAITIANETDVNVGDSRTASVSSNLSERSDSELNINGNGNFAGDSRTATPPSSFQIEHAAASVVAMPAVALEATNTAASFFTATSSPTSIPIAADIANLTSSAALHDNNPEPQQSLNAIQVLITEKAQLTADLNKYRNACREKDLEIEELRLQYNNTAQHLEELQKRFLAHQQSTEQLRNTNAELQHKLAQSNANNEDQANYVEELKKQLDMVQTRSNELDQQLKEKSNELEMSQIRIRQISDETSISKDSRVETLTQTQFMYEQQIRDLQAMVQQLSQDKEQTNTQYQTYVQHLNTEMTNLNEKNTELIDECTKLQERERQLVDHIGQLEREIQKNISRQDQFKEEQKQQMSPEVASRIEKLNEKINDFELERHEFQLKIKSQEDRLEKLNSELLQKQNEIESLHEHLDNVTSEQPDKTKLLATMESDKVAASRALAQNVELKKQLDELELRFVQLTNDKADLMNKLDAEEYANRERRTKFTEMEEQLRSIDERFKFKDEEMIRLSHENMELTRKNLILHQKVDRLKHYEVKNYSDKYAQEDENEDNTSTHDDEHDDNSDSDHGHDHGHNDHHHHHHDHHHHDHNHAHSELDHENKVKQHSDADACQEAEEATEDQHKHADCAQHHHASEHSSSKKYSRQHHNHHDTPNLASSEAVEKLQQRFTQLMTHVADLTDEKQRLEHLVMQLQSETETIGEYISLYQMQRRMLKQREYEKAAQMQLLQEEREKMCEQITKLNNLVSSLGVELPHNTRLKDHLNAALAESVSIEPNNSAQSEAIDLTAVQQQHHHQHEQMLAEMALNEKLSSNESQQILTKIQSIITEIKENTKEVPTVTHTVDHFNCCQGKFEVV